MLNPLGEVYQQLQPGRPATKQQVHEALRKAAEDNRKSTERAKNPGGALKLRGMDKLQAQMTVTNKGMVNLRAQTARQLQGLNREIASSGVETRKELRALRQSFDGYARNVKQLQHLERANRQQALRDSRKQVAAPKALRDAYALNKKADLRAERALAESRLNHRSMHQPRDERGRFMAARPADKKDGGSWLDSLLEVGGAVGGWKALKKLKARLSGRSGAGAAAEAGEGIGKKSAANVAKEAAKKRIPFMGGMLLRKAFGAYTLYEAVKNGPTDEKSWNAQQQTNDENRAAVESTMRDYLPKWLLPEDGEAPLEKWWRGENKAKQEAQNHAQAAAAHPPGASPDQQKAGDVASEVGSVYINALEAMANKSLAIIEQKTLEVQKALLASFEMVKRAEERRETQSRIVKPIDAVGKDKEGKGKLGAAAGGVGGGGGGGDDSPVTPTGPSSPDGANPGPNASGAPDGKTPESPPQARMDTQVDHSRAPGASEGPNYDFGKNVRPDGSAGKPGFSSGIAPAPKPEDAQPAPPVAPSAGPNYDFGKNVRPSPAGRDNIVKPDAGLATPSTPLVGPNYDFGKNVRPDNGSAGKSVVAGTNYDFGKNVRPQRLDPNPNPNTNYDFGKNVRPLSARRDNIVKPDVGIAAPSMPPFGQKYDFGKNVRPQRLDPNPNPNPNANPKVSTPTPPASAQPARAEPSNFTPAEKVYLKQFRKTHPKDSSGDETILNNLRAKKYEQQQKTGQANVEKSKDASAQSPTPEKSPLIGEKPAYNPNMWRPSLAPDLNQSSLFNSTAVPQKVTAPEVKPTVTPSMPEPVKAVTPQKDDTKGGNGDDSADEDKSVKGGDKTKAAKNKQASAAPGAQQKEPTYNDVPAQSPDYMLAQMHSRDTV
jgi:hypothetical protein